MSKTTIAVPARTARIRRTAAVLGGTVVAAMSLTGVAAANGPTYVEGNPGCADIQGSASWTELKIDPPRGGLNRVEDSYLTATATVSGTLFDWAATQGIDAVIVKGGPNANVYLYGSEATSGNDLHAPRNPSNGSYYGLSHITFCYDRGTPPAPPQPGPANPCATDPNGMDANGQPCTPAQPGPSNPCATDPNGMDANGQPCTPAQPGPSNPCATDPSGMDANGQPCTPPAQASDPCATNPSGMAANGEPCTRPAAEWSSTPPVEERPAQQPPVLTRIPSTSASSGGVLGVTQEIVPASASIVRISRCVSRTFSAVVRGRGIRRVTFFVNGRRVRTMTGSRSRYALSVDPAAARNGVIRVTARVDFVARSGKRAKTLRMTALRCATGAQRVRFTG
jgi:hypothetical protein